MSDWTAGELDEIGAADELEIAPSRADGTRYPYTTIWVVRVGENVYVRSYRGTNGRWYRPALEHPEGHVRAGGVERDVAFEHPDEKENDAVDRAYRAKYARFGAQYIDPLLSPAARACTLRRVPR